MNQYRVKAKWADVEVEVESSEKDYTDAKLKELMAMLGSPKVAAEGKATTKRSEPAAAKQVAGKPTSLVEFVRPLSPKTGTQYVIAVGQYLELHGGMADGFKTKDLVAGFRAVKYKHANPSEALRQAKQRGFLMDGKEPGTVVVTQTGEAWVKAQLTGEDEA